MARARTSSHFYFTVTLENGKPIDGHMQRVNEIRELIAIHNRYYPDSKHYVKLQGRLGENNPNAAKYRKKKWNGHQYQTILLADAATADVYVYKR